MLHGIWVLSLLCLHASAAGGSREGAFIGYSEETPRLTCSDAHKECGVWVQKGECTANPYFMRKQCPLACNICGKGVPVPWQGFATEGKTRHYATQMPTISTQAAQGHFRRDPSMGSYTVPGQRVRGVPWLTLSSLGTGTYLGEPDAETDEAVTSALIVSVLKGMNVIDTASNYRSGCGEESVGRALQALRTVPGLTREMLFISTKAGFMNETLLPDLLHKGRIKQTDVLSGSHCIHPACLEASLERSLKAMNIGTVDLLYLHNVAEMQPEAVASPSFHKKLAAAFKFLEQKRKQGQIRAYGMATWTCFRSQPEEPVFLALQKVVELAEEIGGKDHGFRYIQLPINAGMLEAAQRPWQPVTSGDETRQYTVLQAAAELGVGVFASSPLGEGRLLTDSGVLARLEQAPELSNLQTPPGKLLQIVRSTPLVLSAIVGHKKADHVEENVKLMGISPLDEDAYNHVTSTSLQSSNDSFSPFSSPEG